MYWTPQVFSVRNAIAYLDNLLKPYNFQDNSQDIYQKTCIEHLLKQVERQISGMQSVDHSNCSSFMSLNNRLDFVIKIQNILIKNLEKSYPIIDLYPSVSWSLVWYGGDLSKNQTHQLEFWDFLYEIKLSVFNHAFLRSILRILTCSDNHTQSLAYVNWLLSTSCVTIDELTHIVDFQTWLHRCIRLVHWPELRSILNHGSTLRPELVQFINSVMLSESKVEISVAPPNVTATELCSMSEAEECDALNALNCIFGIEGKCFAFFHLDLNKNLALRSTWVNLVQSLSNAEIKIFRQLFLEVFSTHDEAKWKLLNQCLHPYALNLISKGVYEAVILLLNQPNIISALSEKKKIECTHQLLLLTSKKSVSMFLYEAIIRLLDISLLYDPSNTFFLQAETTILKNWWRDSHRLLRDYHFSDLWLDKVDIDVDICISIMKYISQCARKQKFVIDSIKTDRLNFKERLQHCLTDVTISMQALKECEQLWRDESKLHVLLSKIYPLKKDAYPINEEAWVVEIILKLSNMHPACSEIHREKIRFLSTIYPSIQCSNSVHLSVMLLTDNDTLRNYMFNGLVAIFPDSYLFLKKNSMSVLAYALSMPNHALLDLIASYLAKENRLDVDILIKNLDLLDNKGFCLGHLIVGAPKLFNSILKISNDQQIQQFLFLKDKSLRTLLHEVMKDSNLLADLIDIMQERGLQDRFVSWVKVDQNICFAPLYEALNYQSSFDMLTYRHFIPLNSPFWLHSYTQNFDPFAYAIQTKVGLKNYIKLTGNKIWRTYTHTNLSLTELRQLSFLLTKSSLVPDNTRWLWSLLSEPTKKSLWDLLVENIQDSSNENEQLDWLNAAYKCEDTFIYLLNSIPKDSNILRSILCAIRADGLSILSRWSNENFVSLIDWLRSLTLIRRCEVLSFIVNDHDKYDQNIIQKTLVEKLGSRFSSRAMLMTILLNNDDLQGPLHLWSGALYNLYRSYEIYYLRGNPDMWCGLDDLIAFCHKLLHACVVYLQTSTQEAYELFLEEYEQLVDDMIEGFKIPEFLSKFVHNCELINAAEVDKAGNLLKAPKLKFFPNKVSVASSINLYSILQEFKPELLREKYLGFQSQFLAAQMVS